MTCPMSYPKISNLVYLETTFITQIICCKLVSLGGDMQDFTLGPAYGTNIWIINKEWYGLFNYH